MKHTISKYDKKHIVHNSFTQRELDILKRLSEYYEGKSQFCRTIGQKNFALEISMILKKTLKLFHCSGSLDG